MFPFIEKGTTTLKPVRMLLISYLVEAREKMGHVLVQSSEMFTERTEGKSTPELPDWE